MSEEGSRTEPEPSNEVASFHNESPELETEISDEVPLHIPRD